MTNQGQFTGFNADKSILINIPQEFINELLPTIDDLDELRLSVILLSCLSPHEGSDRCISYQVICENDLFLNQFGDDLKRLDIALERCKNRKTIIAFSSTVHEETGDIFFINTPHNKSLVEGLNSGIIQLTDVVMVSGITEKPNIFKLYEENIGLITPMLAEVLKEDEKSFPAAWIADAIKIAVQHNARNWKYIHAILVSWQKEGRDGKNGQNLKKNRRKYQESWLGEKGKEH
ncbi:MAG: DnaD domain protein [Anaerolineaceae bacterium]|nr:DnaD domain protein [Anaerolineaceae bacterium]